MSYSENTQVQSLNDMVREIGASESYDALDKPLVVAIRRVLAVVLVFATMGAFGQDPDSANVEACAWDAFNDALLVFTAEAPVDGDSLDPLMRTVAVLLCSSRAAQVTRELAPANASQACVQSTFLALLAMAADNPAEAVFGDSAAAADRRALVVEQMDFCGEAWPVDLLSFGVAYVRDRGTVDMTAQEWRNLITLMGVVEW